MPHSFDPVSRSPALPGPLAGVGLKPAHVAGLLAGEAAVDFLEVHAENYLVAGGPFLRHLGAVRERWPLSIHGVGLSIGGAAPLDREHLARIAGLVQRFEPRWFSEHLAWSSHGGVFLNDLLPLPYNPATLVRVCDHVDEVQTALRRPLLLENPSTYLALASATMDEAAFLGEVVKRTGCGLLLDLNNAHVSAVNHGRSAWSFIEQLPLAAVGEVHLAGFTTEQDGDGGPLLIDTHGSDVDEAVWGLYRGLLERIGPVPTLIERDRNVPTLTELAREAARARSLMSLLAKHPVERAPC